MPSASLAFTLSISLTITHRAHEWMEARRLYGESVRRLRHCEYFNKVGPYCWRSNVLIPYDNYCFDGCLLSCGTNYNLSNMKAPCGIYFRNRLPYIAWDIVKILTKDASVDRGAKSIINVCVVTRAVFIKDDDSLNCWRRRKKLAILIEATLYIREKIFLKYL